MVIHAYLPLIFVIVGAISIFFVVHWFFKKRADFNQSNKYYHQLFNNVYAVLVLIAVIAASPISDSLKGQILSLIGIVVSGAFALSSTTLLGNALAGVMLRMIRNFRGGDFIQVNDYFGKVSGRTLLSVEIQSIDRGLISIPNTYLVANPVKVFPESGVFITVEVSLGYDVPRNTVEAALIEAASQNGIENAYVEVKSLLDHSINYSLHALVTDLERYFALKSRIHASVVDQLHQSKVEIVSPNFMNTRSIGDKPIIPEPQKTELVLDDDIDALLFEKANLADKLELLRDKLNLVENMLNRKDATVEFIERAQKRKQALIEKIEAFEKDVSKSS